MMFVSNAQINVFMKFFRTEWSSLPRRIFKKNIYVEIY